MITFAAVLLVLFGAYALARLIAHDGYGSRPAPRSHHDETEPAAWYDARLAP
jgi:hypothetical protein